MRACDFGSEAKTGARTPLCVFRFDRLGGRLELRHQTQKPSKEEVIRKREMRGW